MYRQAVTEGYLHLSNLSLLRKLMEHPVYLIFSISKISQIHFLFLSDKMSSAWRWNNFIIITYIVLNKVDSRRTVCTLLGTFGSFKLRNGFQCDIHQ